MQIQKDLNKYELYSDNASCARNIAGIGSGKIKKTVVTFLMVLLALVTIAVSLTVVNVAFDNAVFSISPDFSLKDPGYSAQNAVFANIKTSVIYSVCDRGGEEVFFSSEVVELGEALKAENILLDENSVVNYSLDTDIFNGMKVVVDSVVYETLEINTSIPYDVTTIEVQTIPKGTRNVLTQGQDGSAISTIRRKYVNGVFDSDEVLSRVVLTEPVPGVEQLGVGGSYVGKNGVTYNYSYYIDVVATCYGPSDGSTGTITATGTKAREGIIAVDPRTIPLGSMVYVTSDYRDLGVLTAEDTGGYIKGNRIDVYLEGSLEDLLQFGRRDMRVYVIE